MKSGKRTALIHDPQQQPVLHEALKFFLADSAFTVGAEISRVGDVERHDGQIMSSAISRTVSTNNAVEPRAINDFSTNT